MSHTASEPRTSYSTVVHRETPEGVHPLGPQPRRSLTWDRGKLSRWNPNELEAVARALNSRPHKALDWKTPAKSSTSANYQYKKPVLRRPIESAQYTSVKLTTHLTRLSIEASMGR